MRYRRASEAFFCVFLLLPWMGHWGPSWMKRGPCVYGWGGWQDLVGLSTASSARLGPGELPSVLQGHWHLSPYAWLLLSPTPHFPHGNASSERGKAYPR